MTNENIDKEHICCAIANNNDIQVSSKKAWLQGRFDDGLVFLKRKNEESVLLSIFLLKMHGTLLLQMIICILTVFGWLALSKGMVIQQIY